MKRFAKASEPPNAIPIVVIAIHVHITVVAPATEDRETPFTVRILVFAMAIQRPL
jgi:hypothetical protein